MKTRTNVNWKCPNSKLTALLGATALLTLTSLSAAQATTVTGGTLTVAEADQLEAWLDGDEYDFTNVFSGDAGAATAQDFHAAADGAGPTFAVYDITLYDGTSAKIGGYTTVDWGSANGYYADSDAFIFNLTTGELQTQQAGFESTAVFVDSDQFAHFGGGFDIFAGRGTLGTCYGTVNDNCDGVSYSNSYDYTQGQIALSGDSGFGFGDSGYDFDAWSVNSLEVYTLTPVQMAPVPLPAGLPLLAAALGALGIARRRAR